jgi:glutathione synthase
VKHAFVVDPLPRLLPDKDTTIAFMREAAARGHDVWTGQAERLGVAEGGQPYAWLAPTRVFERDDWFELGEPTLRHLRDFDVVWMRKDPPYDLDYFYWTHILDLVHAPTLVVNAPRGLRDVTEKLFTLRHPELCPETLVSRSIEELLDFRDKLGGEMIIKPLGGSGGEGVFHLTPDDRNVRAILEIATRHGREYQMGQRYLPQVRDGDKRLIVLEGEPIGAVLRVPRPWESRANFHVGGTAVRAPITARDREICAALAPDLAEHGILFAGLDVIGDLLTELNVTSPTGIREINALDGVRLERQVLDAVERRHRKGG